MIFRFSFRAHCRPGLLPQVEENVRARLPALQDLVREGVILTSSLYHWGEQLFCYVESLQGDLQPERLFGTLDELLLPWPGDEKPRFWVPMIDVFHFNAPADLEHWRRKGPIERRIGKVARLRPEMFASYVYYHFQLQEERAFLGEKYKFICAHENLMFMYDETPPTVELPVLPGKLKGHNTPKNWEETRMDLHFIPWDPERRFFKEIDPILSV